MLGTLVRYLPSLKEVEITRDLYLDKFDMHLEHVNGTLTTLSEKEIEL